MIFEKSGSEVPNFQEFQGGFFRNTIRNGVPFKIGTWWFPKSWGPTGYFFYFWDFDPKMTSFWGHFGGHFCLKNGRQNASWGSFFGITIWRWKLSQTTLLWDFGPVGLKNGPHFSWKWGHFLTVRVTKLWQKSSGDNWSPGSWRTFGIQMLPFYAFFSKKGWHFWCHRTEGPHRVRMRNGESVEKRETESSFLCRTKMTFLES